jgi:hypothetical protein
LKSPTRTAPESLIRTGCGRPKHLRRSMNRMRQLQCRSPREHCRSRSASDSNHWSDCGCFPTFGLSPGKVRSMEWQISCVQFMIPCQPFDRTLFSWPQKVDLTYQHLPVARRISSYPNHRKLFRQFQTVCNSRLFAILLLRPSYMFTKTIATIPPSENMSQKAQINCT